MNPLRVATAIVATALLVLSSGCSSDNAKAQEPEHASSQEPEASPVPLVGSADQPGSISGVVVTFDDSKGFGFILPDDGSKMVGVSRQDIVMDGPRTLEMGQRVLFEVDSLRKAPVAINVTVVEEP